MAEHGLKNVFFLSAQMQQRGTSKYTLSLAKELARRGYAISVACGPGPLAGRFSEATIDHVEYDHIDSRLRSPFLVRKIARQMRDCEADVFHLQSSEALGLGLALASVVRIPMVATIHRPLLRGWRIWRLGRKAVRVIAVSEAVREDLVNLGGVPKEKIEVIPNGLDLNEYAAPPPRAAGPPVIGVIGPLEKVKGQEFFLDAAKAILNTLRDVEIVIVGSGSEEANLRRQARRLGIAKQVTLATDIADYRPVLSTIDIFVLPSLQEGFGFSVLEAMASGKPVVASAVGGVYSLVIDGETGFLVDKGDGKAIAARVLQILRNPEMAAQMGKRAREMVEKEFDIWKVANRTVEQYKLALEPAAVV
ncbi:MAG: glycosyltransferase family 4 protein [Planctomycetes bacterium]|nr:glycosyltransferase family 4 protein [Planctomycetota bacterium]